uniref:Dynein regulatory complex protein 1 n=1 Tax=Knipowitschia caucasica TaxID=637954 RepID=A0AAV2KF69_KNICA
MNPSFIQGSQNRMIRRRRSQNMKKCKDKLEEICKGWHSTKEKVIPEEVQAALLHQQQLCEELLQDKKTIMDFFQQDIKARDDVFVADLKKQTEELQLMLERMEQQDKTLTKAYREELDQWKDNVQKQEEMMLAEEKTKWEKCMKNLLDTEVDRLSKREQAVEEFNGQIHNLMFETLENFNIVRNKEVDEFQRIELEIHQIETEKIFLEQKIEGLKADNAKVKTECSQLKTKVASKKSELKKQRANKETTEGKRKQLMEKQLKELNHKAQDYERLQKKKIHIAVNDAIQYENMWLSQDAECKELLERALHVESKIHEHFLHLPWEQPNLSFAKPGVRWEGCGQEQADDLKTFAHNGESVTESVNSKSEKETERESNVATPRTAKRLMEILCDETDAEATEPRCSTVEVEASGSVTPDPIDRTDILEALKCFLDKQEKLENPSRVKWSVQSLEPQDSSKEKAYWESLGNAITADKLKVWEVMEKKLKQHHTVMSKISEFNQEVQSLQQENTELQMVCMLLQQSD